MDYYISNHNGQYSGPFKKNQLIDNGLDLESLVWRQGLAAWTPANRLKELADIMDDVPPPMEMTLGSSGFEQQPVCQDDNQLALMQELAKSKQEIEELKKSVEKLENASKKTDQHVMVNTTNKKLTTASPKAQTAKKENSETKKKQKGKSKYDHPVCDWRNESIWLLVFVVCHAMLAICGYTTFFYLYLDIVGAVLSIIGIVIGCKIRKLNAISYKKNSESRLKAEPLGYFNGIFVSTTAAVGFLIILVQSAHYVYVC